MTSLNSEALHELPLISIIMPVKNGATFIRHAIQSILMQKYGNIEIIIVDGVSTDGTLEILSDFTKAHSFIKLISEIDTGQSQAMNKGLRLATGDIIGFLNADDFYSESVFHQAVTILTKLSRPALVVGNCHVHDLESKKVHVQKPSYLALESFILNISGHPANSSQYFYHAEIHHLIGGFPENEHLAMDLWFYLECCSHPTITKKYVNADWGNFRFYLGTKTYDNRHLHKEIQRRYRLKYLKRIRLQPLALAIPVKSWQLSKKLAHLPIRIIERLKKRMKRHNSF